MRTELIAPPTKAKRAMTRAVFVGRLSRVCWGEPVRAYATAAVRAKREAARAGALGFDCLELELAFGWLRG